MSDINRPSRDWINLEIAKIISMRGTCLRMKVGCVITKNGRIVSTGYNGPLSTESDCIDLCNLETRCEHAIHAEQNAIVFAASTGISLYGATLYCTHGPCHNCASLMVQTGIARVVYLVPYRLSLGLEILKRANIETFHYESIKSYQKGT